MGGRFTWERRRGILTQVYGWETRQRVCNIDFSAYARTTCINALALFCCTSCPDNCTICTVRTSSQ